MIRIRNLFVRKNSTLICNVPKLDVEPGERIAIMGSNGSGKSTLLCVLGGLEKAAEGQYEIEAPESQRCYVHQTPLLFRGTVLRNTTYGLRANGVARGKSARLATDMLDRLGLADAVSKSARHLSGGERRRVAVARACLLKPKLLLLDEPFADLDNAGVTALNAELDRLQSDDQCTVVIASPEESHELSSCRIVIIGGER